MRKERDTMETELTDVKAIAIEAEQSYKEEVEEMRNQWQSEVGSMQQIMTSKSKKQGWIFTFSSTSQSGW